MLRHPGNYVFFDLASDIIFGQDWNSIDKPENRIVVNAIQTSNIRVGILSNFPKLRFHRLDKKLFPTAIMARGHSITFIKQTVGYKMTQKEKTQDIFSTLVHSKDEATGTKLTMEELAGETANLIAAGRLSFPSTDFHY